MFVIVEGVDRTGKTTLAEELAQVHGGQRIHHGRPWCHPVTEYALRFSDWEPRVHPPLILDRGHIGELIWPHIFKRASQMGRAEQTVIEHMLLAKGAVLVHTVRDMDEVCASNYGEPWEADQIRRAANMFEAEVETSELPSITVDIGASGRQRREACERVAELAFSQERSL